MTDIDGNCGKEPNVENREKENEEEEHEAIAVVVEGNIIIVFRRWWEKACFWKAMQSRKNGGRPGDGDFAIGCKKDMLKKGANYENVNNKGLFLEWSTMKFVYNKHIGNNESK